MEQNTKPLLDTIELIEAELKKVDAAIKSLCSIANKLPTQFRTLHSGNVHNLDTPQEYTIYVGIENIKDAYSLNKELSSTRAGVQHLKKSLQNYKKK